MKTESLIFGLMLSDITYPLFVNMDGSLENIIAMEEKDNMLMFYGGDSTQCPLMICDIIPFNLSDSYTVVYYSIPHKKLYLIKRMVEGGKKMMLIV